MKVMASGRPLISKRHSGMPDLIDDGVSGLLTNEPDVRELAGPMARIIGNEVLKWLFVFAART